MKNKALYILLVALTACTSPEAIDTTTQKEELKPEPTPRTEGKIQIALLLDTSNSMDGLIEQAKSQLWSIVSYCSRFKLNDQSPGIELALYEYGNDRLNYETGYIRQITTLTTELDSVSEGLFDLTTLGGEEYCGAVIKSSLNQLNWEDHRHNYQVIFIAGNEPFDQGMTPFTSTCQQAAEHNIFVNTIFCGDYEEGKRTKWQKGAQLANGAYLNIDQNLKTTYVATPFDDTIAQLNDSLNSTYIYYGSNGRSKFLNQSVQDMNSKNYGLQNKVNRTITKGSHAYDNSSWDLVDANNEKDFDLKKVDRSSLDSKYSKLSDDEMKAEISKQAQRRETFKTAIAALQMKRQVYIDSVSETPETDGLSQVMQDAIREQAESKGFTIR